MKEIPPTLNNEDIKRFVNNVRSIILTGFAGAVLIPAAACADNNSSPREAPREALIVDQLRITDPNPVFIFDIVDQLRLEGGFDVNYVPPEDVNVEFYEEKLANYDNSKMIIIRSHSGIVDGSNDAALFTAERHDMDSYVREQIEKEVFTARFLDSQETLYFAIGSKFVENEMEGEFEKGTIVIVMGCDGLTNTSLAEAFLKKGARAYFGFDGPVSPQYTDEATRILIRHLVTDDMPPEDALFATKQEIGPDPVFGGEMLVLEEAK